MGSNAFATGQYWSPFLDSCILQPSRRQRLSRRESMKQNDWRSRSNLLRAEAYWLRPTAPDMRPPSWDAVTPTRQHTNVCVFSLLLFLVVFLYHHKPLVWIHSVSHHRHISPHWCFLSVLALFFFLPHTIVRNLVLFTAWQFTDLHSNR